MNFAEKMKKSYNTIEYFLIETFNLLLKTTLDNNDVEKINELYKIMNKSIDLYESRNLSFTKLKIEILVKLNFYNIDEIEYENSNNNKIYIADIDKFSTILVEKIKCFVYKNIELLEKINKLIYLFLQCMFMGEKLYTHEYYEAIRIPHIILSKYVNFIKETNFEYKISYELLKKMVMKKNISSYNEIILQNQYLIEEAINRYKKSKINLSFFIFLYSNSYSIEFGYKYLDEIKESLFIFNKYYPDTFGLVDKLKSLLAIQEKVNGIFKSIKIIFSQDNDFFIKLNLQEVLMEEQHNQISQM